MPLPKDEEIKIRVTSAMKEKFRVLAAARSTEAHTVSEASLAREAFDQFLTTHADELKDALPLPAPGTPPIKPVTYRKPSRKDTERKVEETVKKRAAELRAARAARTQPK